MAEWARVDLFAVLGVSEDADEDAIQKAFRRESVKHHPDKTGNADGGERFKIIGAARDVLVDAERREEYLAARGSTRRPRYARPGAAATPFDAWMAQSRSTMGAAFAHMRAGAGAASDARRTADPVWSHDQAGPTAARGRERGHAAAGADVGCTITVSLDDAFAGATRQVAVEQRVKCPACNGHGGTLPAPAPPLCAQCGFHGVHLYESALGTLVCSRCLSASGRGRTDVGACDTCNGTGAAVRRKQIEVVLPKSVASGGVITVHGEGDYTPGPGYSNGRHGNLVVVVNIEPHHIYTRNGLDLHTVVTIDLVTSLAGGDVPLRYLAGETLTLVLPAGEIVRHGEVRRIRARGMLDLASPLHTRGDLVVEFRIDYPVAIDLPVAAAIRHIFNRPAPPPAPVGPSTILLPAAPPPPPPPPRGAHTPGRCPAPPLLKRPLA